MNPPVRQKPIHHRALGREHVRVLFRRALGLLLLGEPGARVIDDPAIAGGHDAPCAMRGRAEFVWLGEDARVVWLFVLCGGGCAAGWRAGCGPGGIGVGEGEEGSG